MRNSIIRIDKALCGISDIVNRFCGIISGIFILFISVIVTYEIIMRFIFRSPTSWVLETSIYLMIACVFLAAGYTQREKNHINVDFLTSRLCKQDQLILEFITTLLSVSYIFVLILEGWKLALSSFISGEVSPTPLAVPIYIPWSFVPLGGVLLLIELISNLAHIVSKAITRDEKDNNKSVFPKWIFPLLFLILSALCTWMVSVKGIDVLGITMLLFLLLFSGMPVAFAMGFIGVIGFVFALGGIPMLIQIPLISYKVLDDFVLVAVPCFIMTSVVLMIGGVGPNLFEVASKWVRHLPGGLAVAAILSSGVFAAISGSSTATVATIGVIALPEMISRGYPRSFSYGTMAIGGVLGPLIPPSIYMLVIGAMTGDSVGKLFMAGMLPGIMLMILFAGFIVYKSIRDKSIPKMKPCSMNDRLNATLGAFWGLMAPVVILGGIYSGIFTATEAAAIGVTYGLFISIFMYRTISFEKLRKIILETAKLNAMILFIVAGSMVFGQVTIMLEVPQIVCKYLAGLPFSPMIILWLVLFFIIVLGALMDELSILLITYPILYYIFVQHFEFNSIWFALVFVFTLEVGLVAPPVGINLFVVQGIDKTAMFEEVVKGVWPFVLIMIAAILLIVYIEPLSLWLPELLS